MANDDSARPDHTQNVSRIDAPVGYLRVVRIDTPKDNAILETGHDLAHSLTEEAGTGAKVFRWSSDRSSGIGVADDIINSLHLCSKCRVA